MIEMHGIKVSRQAGAHAYVRQFVNAESSCKTVAAEKYHHVEQHYHSIIDSFRVEAPRLFVCRRLPLHIQHDDVVVNYNPLIRSQTKKFALSTPSVQIVEQPETGQL